MSHTLKTETTRQWLSFRVDDEEFGIDLLQVQEIRSYESPMRIANGPAYFNGVLELRGEVIPVIDLRLRLGLAHKQYDACTVTIMLRLPGGVTGMVVEGVTDVVTLMPQDLRAVPDMGGGLVNDCLLALGVLDERSLLLIDAHRLLSPATATAALPDCAAI
ncbi:chemotaxis protein CheW [Delftia sp. ASV31]|uniref:chemotaxis protein CheW n=1 Tax=Delftia sp. ASV31 TaxID=2795113 RepID=UPI0018EB9902|nr:chemotaxis protein CheW [Delftia sp. ASV31]